MVVDLTFDSAVFSLETVKAACYRFTDRFTPGIETVDGKIICHLQFEPELSDVAVHSEVSNFQKEVLDQDLRAKLKTETEAVRNVILAHAFSKTGLIADE